MKENILKAFSFTILFYFFSCSEKIDIESFYLKQTYIEKEILKFKSSKTTIKLGRFSEIKMVT